MSNLRRLYVIYLDRKLVLIFCTRPVYRTSNDHIPPFLACSRVGRYRDAGTIPSVGDQERNMTFS